MTQDVSLGVDWLTQALARVWGARGPEFKFQWVRFAYSPAGPPPQARRRDLMALRGCDSNARPRSARNDLESSAQVDLGGRAAYHDFELAGLHDGLEIQIDQFQVTTCEREVNRFRLTRFELDLVEPT
jgi:hypothetical protein